MTSRDESPVEGDDGFGGLVHAGNGGRPGGRCHQPWVRPFGWNSRTPVIDVHAHIDVRAIYGLVQDQPGPAAEQAEQFATFGAESICGTAAGDRALGAGAGLKSFGYEREQS